MSYPDVGFGVLTGSQHLGVEVSMSFFVFFFFDNLN
jgi:hypothetical protein